MFRVLVELFDVVFFYADLDKRATFAFDSVLPLPLIFASAFFGDPFFFGSLLTDLRGSAFALLLLAFLDTLALDGLCRVGDFMRSLNYCFLAVNFSFFFASAKNANNVI